MREHGHSSCFCCPFAITYLNVAALFCLFILSAGCAFFSSLYYTQTCTFAASVRGAPTFVGFLSRRKRCVYASTNWYCCKKAFCIYGGEFTSYSTLWLRVATAYENNITNPNPSPTPEPIRPDQPLFSVSPFASRTVCVNHTRYQCRIRCGALYCIYE